MQLDRLAVQLRPRNPWEAMDLGFLMVRTWLKPIYAPWLTLYLPAWAIAMFVVPEPWGLLALWWLKPQFDRVILHVLSNGVFGELPSWRQTLRASPSTLRPGLLRWLTWARFDLARSFNLPVWQLERQRGRAARDRAKQLQRRTRGYAIWLTVACVHLETFLAFAVIALFDLLAPASMHSEFELLSLLSIQDLGRQHALFAGAYLIAVSVVEPLYVAGGFALYLNRRTALEGWDIEVQLRRIGERRRESQRALAAGTTLLLALVLSACLIATPAPAGAQEQPAPERLAPDTRAAQQIKEVLKRKEFQTYQTQNVLRRTTPASAGSFDWRWLDAVVSALGYSMRIAAWVLLGLAVTFLAYLLLRHFDPTGLFARRQRKRHTPPDTVFGLDVRPESLPDDLPAEALRLARAGELLQALSLLYRGALITLLHRDGLELVRGDTEDDCLRKSAHRIPDAAYAYFANLLIAWQRLAYARRPVSFPEIEALCTTWDRHFKR